MTEYALYLESGPRRRTTMVHVLDLLGCVVQRRTTEEALEATPEAIRAYLRFVKRHGEAVEPEGDFTTVIAEHVMEGPWIGYGDPSPGFAPDFQPLTPEDLCTYLRRLVWLQDDLMELIDGLSPEQLSAEPPEKGWSIRRILEHVAEGQSNYTRLAVGRVEGLSEALRAVQQGWEPLPLALPHLFEIGNVRLEAMTETEREQAVPHGQMVWTARRAIRRMLEHNWEHLLQVSRRLEV